MLMSRRKPKINKQDKPGLPPELRRAIDADKITPQRALRLIEEGGEATEDTIVDQDSPSQNVVVLRVNEVVIDWLVRRERITRSQWEAATKLRNHFEQSGLDQLRAMDPTMDVVDGGQSKPEPLFRTQHLSAFNDAIRRLGPWTYSVISDVVLNDRRPEDASVSGLYRDKQRKGVETLTVLRMGLSVLALHWRLPKDWKD
jgi:hypothetical protein